MQAVIITIIIAGAILMVINIVRYSNFLRTTHDVISSGMGGPLVTYLEPGSFRLFKELQIASGISANQIKPVRVIDNKKKTQFFFGLSEGPYKAMSRVLFDVEQKYEELIQLQEENKKLKKENQELKAALQNINE